MVILPTGHEGSAGPFVFPDYFLLAQLAQLSHSERRADGSQARTHRHTTRPDPRAKMSNFSNKFGAYTMTQLNEILEDDDKLTKMVHEMDEVG